MNNRIEMGVVIIEDVTGDAIEEGGVHDVETLAPPEQRGLRRPGKRRQRRHRDIDGLVMRSADDVRVVVAQMDVSRRRPSEPIQWRELAIRAEHHRIIPVEDINVQCRPALDEIV